MDVTLVVMAAGVGSRFGGLKQVEPITTDGKCILDFSVYDAVKSGFNKVVFIIRKEMEDDFKRLIGDRIAKRVKVEYVLQDTSTLPGGRNKPFGTAHAVLCCKNAVRESFAIINADDYYGRHAFDSIYAHLTSAKNGEYAMVAYKMGNTVSSNGGVTRGVCEIVDGKLKSIVETCDITRDCVCSRTGKRFDPNTSVSMNLWGLTCDIFPYLEKEFDKFLRNADLEKDEFLMPVVIADAVSCGIATVTAYENADKWHGVTYRQDFAEVREALSGYIAQGLYDGM